MYCVLCLMSRLSIQEIKALDTSMVQMLCYVDTVDTHVSAHNFLNIQRIFNPEKVLECWEPGLSNHTTKSYICRSSRSMSKQSIHCVQNKLHSMVRMSKQSIHRVQNTLHSIARMSRRSIQASNYIVYHNSNYSNKEIHRIIASNYSLFRIKT